MLVSILAIVYLSTSMGATVHFHYCMGRLVAWGLADHTGKTCDFCGMQKMDARGDSNVGVNGCCHEESRQIRNDKDQKAGGEFFQLAKMMLLSAPMPKTGWVDPVVSSPVLSRPFSHGPPLAGSTPVFLRCCTFRI